MTVPPSDEELSPDAQGNEVEAQLASGPEKADEQDELAAEWEAMASDTEGQRVLNQDEIDSLLSTDGSSGAQSDHAGIQAVLNAARSDRLPMLDVVFDRLVRMMSTSLRNFTSDNVDVSLDNITSLKFRDYQESIVEPAMIGVFKAEEWDNYGLLVIDSSLVYSTIDVLLGGRQDTAAMRSEGRPYTTIERSLLERMMRVILADLSLAFEPISIANFNFMRLETNPSFAAISQPSNAAIVCKLRVDMEDRGGRVELLLPYATLEPVRELLLQMFMGEKFGRDSIWETHLAEELWQTDIELTAILDEQTITLGQICELKVGSQLMLNATPKSSVDVVCGAIPMFKGLMGRKGRNIAIQVTEKILKELEE
jgi:flagellar motor switch protein FliM